MGDADLGFTPAEDDHLGDARRFSRRNGLVRSQGWITDARAEDAQRGETHMTHGTKAFPG